MRVIYIVPKLHKSGGIQEFAKSIYTQLKDKFDIEIWDWEDDLSLSVSRILRYFPPKIGAFLYTNLLSKHFKKKYKAINCEDLIHFWHPEPAMAFLDKRYIVTCHGVEILPDNIKGFRKIMYSRVLNNAAFVSVDSGYTKKLVIKIFNISEEKIKVINPSIDYKKFASQNKMDKNKIVIGTLTRLEKRKNVQNIISALNILKEKHGVNFKYYLAGDGSEKKKVLEELYKAKFEWEYFGEISEERKIKEFYPSLDVFVLPTLELPNDVEGFGIVYLESNAYGVPVVASRTGGVPDAVKEGASGEFASPTNPEDIAIKISDVLKNKQKYFQSAKDWIKQFDSKIIANEFVGIYSEVKNTGERIIPGKFGSKEDYFLYLRHLFAYEFTKDKIQKNNFVLEVGCGEGYGTSLLSQNVVKIIGLDTDENMIAHASKKYRSENCIFRVYNGVKIPYGDDTFDVIISFQTIEHIQDDKSFLLEVHKVLKKQGIFILTTPNRTYRLKPGQKPWNPYHVREYYHWELENLLKSVFREVKVIGIRGKGEIQKIEIDRVKPNLSVSFDFIKLRKFLPEPIKQKLINIMNKRKLKPKYNDFQTKYSTKDFYITENASQGLDLLGICIK